MNDKADKERVMNLSKRYRPDPILAVVLLAVVALCQTACNTMRGAGQDVERAGQEIKKEAHDVGTDEAHDID
jgi:predicted small secreted protein